MNPVNSLAYNFSEQNLSKWSKQLDNYNEESKYAESNINHWIDCKCPDCLSRLRKVLKNLIDEVRELRENQTPKENNVR